MHYEGPFFSNYFTSFFTIVTHVFKNIYNAYLTFKYLAPYKNRYDRHIGGHIRNCERFSFALFSSQLYLQKILLSVRHLGLVLIEYGYSAPQNQPNFYGNKKQKTLSHVFRLKNAKRPKMRNLRNDIFRWSDADGSLVT